MGMPRERVKAILGVPTARCRHTDRWVKEKSPGSWEEVLADYASNDRLTSALRIPDGDGWLMEGLGEADDDSPFDRLRRLLPW
jgi:hypothetical protein